MNCGTDIIEISRIKESIEEHGKVFLNKVYTADEIKYCESKKSAKYQHYAARFAAKEAVAKFFGTGFSGVFDWTEIEIKNDEFGKPEVKLIGKALKLFQEQKYSNITVSISHCKEYAISMVIGY